MAACTGQANHRIQDRNLERLVGRLTLENELPKKGLQHNITSLDARGIHPPMSMFRHQYPERMPDDEYRQKHVLLPAPSPEAGADVTDRIEAICLEFL